MFYKKNLADAWMIFSFKELSHLKEGAVSSSFEDDKEQAFTMILSSKNEGVFEDGLSMGDSVLKISKDFSVSSLIPALVFSSLSLLL